MTQTCQQGLWGHDPDPELGVQGHEPDHPSTGSQAEGLWAARGGGSWAAAGRLAAEEEAATISYWTRGLPQPSCMRLTCN